MSTKLIQQRFDRASETYDAVCTVQRESAVFLCSKFIEDSYGFDLQTILDCGCGTGIITEMMLQYFPNASYHLNDLSGKMLERCQQKLQRYNNLRYLHGDMLLLGDRHYDAIISNLALQWVPDVFRNLQYLYQRTNKILAFSTLLPGSFGEWYNLVKQYQITVPPTYVEKTALIEWVTMWGEDCKYWQLDLDINFSTVREFLIYLRALGINATESVVNPSRLRGLLREDRSVNITYKIFFAIMKKR